MASSRILLISDTGTDTVGVALETPGHAVTHIEAVADVVDAAAFEVVVLDLEGDASRAMAACREVRESALGDIPILALNRSDDVEDRIGLLEAGADDVMPRPFDARELDARVEALALRYQRSHDMSGGRGSSPVITDRNLTEHRTIVVYSPKGGVGTTTVAVNIAVALANRDPDRVAIVDLDLQFGQVSTHLNIPPRLSVAELARDEVALRDGNVLQTYTDRHASGLAVLAAPHAPDAASGVTGANVQQILDTLSKTYRYVVVDAGSVLDGRSETAITKATDLVIVVTPEFPALKAVHALRELLQADADQVAETSFVLNQIFAREILRIRDIEEALGTKVASTIPYDAFAFLKSVNEGVPVVIGAPRTPAAEHLSRLALALAGVVVADAGAPKKPKGLGGLFGRG
ncbi:MAG: AAA family ATPase [Chloroflexi bacterium]|nr:AAA family ATPase [Chloroflexota bacterium]